MLRSLWSPCCAIAVDPLAGEIGADLGTSRIVVVLAVPLVVRGAADETVRSDSFCAFARSAWLKADHAGEDRN